MEVRYFGQEPLFQALGIGPGVTALVGGGGKTSAMLRLVEELSAHGSVIMATTTHIYPPSGIPVLLDATTHEIASALEHAPAVCVGSLCADGKLGPGPVDAEALAALGDYVIVEADGAKGMPLKAPASHEPVIPPCAHRVVAVAGLDGMGCSIGEAAFRPALYAKLLGTEEGHIVTPEDVARALCSRDGQYKHVGPHMDFCVLLNKADDGERVTLAEQVAAYLDTTRVKCAVIAKLQCQ